MLDMDAFKDINVEIKLDGKKYFFNTPTFQHVMVIQDLSVKMAKAQTKLSEEDSAANTANLNSACEELIITALGYDNKELPEDYIKSMNSIKKVRLATQLALWNSEAFTGGTDSGI